MIIDCISDLHGHYPKLEGGDLLIVAGDLTARDRLEEYYKFFDWFYYEQDYQKKILIAGNHDVTFQDEEYEGPEGIMKGAFVYLCDSGIELGGIKIWGSPWTLKFPGMNKDCMAFTVDTEEELADKWAMIPLDIDILITHSPPWGNLDEIRNYYTGKVENVGSKTLTRFLETKLKPKLHVFGHIHEGGGQQLIYKRPGYGTENNTIMVNASIMNERYHPVNKPVRVELC